jgi:subtilisin-like proprotein convertase family protein
MKSTATFSVQQTKLFLLTALQTIFLFCLLFSHTNQSYAQGCPTAGTLSGAQLICAGSLTNFSSTVTGGTWSSTNASVATVSAAGVVSGVAGGTATITYTIAGTGSCSDAVATRTITVNPAVVVSAVPTQVINSGGVTNAITFASTVSGTTFNWSNSNTSVLPIAAGSGNIASFTAFNAGLAPIFSTVTVTGSALINGITCSSAPVNFDIVVNPVAQVDLPSDRTVCGGATVPAINFVSPNTGGTVTYLWSNSNTAIGLAASGTGNIAAFTASNSTTSAITATITVVATFTNGGVTNTSTSKSFVITVLPRPTVSAVSNQNLCVGATATINFSGTLTGTTYAWTNSNTAIGLAASGTGNISFVAANATADQISSTLTVTPSATVSGLACAGAPINFTITINPVGQVNGVLSQVLCAGSTTTAATLSTTNQQGINVPASVSAASGAISLAIPDNAPAGVTSTLPVSLPAGATVTGVRVTLNATHTWVSDLVINLRAPNGQVLNLFNGHGGSGDDLVNTVISSTGTASLASATAPFTGTFAATGALNVGATGQTSTTSGFPALYSGGSGNWVLSLRDQVGFDVGTLTGWSITVDYTTLLGGLTTYTWTNSNSAIGLAASGSGNTIAAFTASNTTSAPIVSTVTVTPTYTNGGLSCAGGAITYTYTVNPIPTVNVSNQVLCAGTPATVNFTGATTGTVYNWTSSNAAIGLAVSGTGNLSFTPTNTTNLPISSTVVVTPVFTNAGVTCTGTPRTFTITVNPVGQVNTVLSQVLCNGANTTPVSFATVNGGGTVVAGTPVTANSGAITVAVPDASAAGVTHSLPVTLPAGATITGVSVNFNMTHTWLSDMVVNLRAPNGQVLNLVNRRGGSGDNFVNTTISSASTTSLATGAAPFTGTFAADAALNVGPTTFVSTATNFAALYSVANGDWTLGMRDYAGGDLGTLTGWSITFNYTTVEGAVTTYNWTNNTPSIGLAASGVGNIASFAAANTSAVPVTATVTVTPTYTNSGVGCAGPSTTFTYTVNPTPTVAAVSNQTVCRGASVAAINFAGTVSGTVYNWTNSNTAIGLGASGTGNIPSFVGTNTTSAPISGTITVTPVSTINGITCTGTPRTFTITINPIPTVNAVASFAICHNSPASVTFSGATTGTVYNWTNSNTTIGLGASGSGNLAFTALNTTSGPQVANIVVTPAFTNGGTTCTGTPTSFTITVNPLPVVSAGSLPARICISDTLVPLNGTPVGGSWSGIGTSGMSFVPTATAVGTWPITYTFADLNGCVNRATIPVTVLSCDERDRDLNSSGVQLYPNPNNGRFNLRVNSTRFNMLGMRVFNTAGQLVSVKQWSGLVFARVVPVDLSNLPAGIYMVRLYYGDGMDRGADKTFQVIIAR